MTDDRLNGSPVDAINLKDIAFANELQHAHYLTADDYSAHELRQRDLAASAIDSPTLVRDLRPDEMIVLLGVPRLPASVADTHTGERWFATLPDPWRNVPDYFAYINAGDWGRQAFLLMVAERAKLLDEVNAKAQPTKLLRRGWRELLDLPPVAWLVDGLVPVGGIVVAAAEPGVGKTLVGVDLALRLAHADMTMHGRSMRRASTLYLAGEGWHGLGSRVRGWRAAHAGEVAHPDCWVDFAPLPSLIDAAGVHALESAIAERPTCGLVAIDTLSLAVPGVNENDAGELGAVLRTIVRLRDQYACAFWIAHHLGKDATRSAMHRVRGSSALVAAADAVLHLRRDPADDSLIVETIKQRDGAVAPPVRLAVQIGQEGPWLAPAGEVPAQTTSAQDLAVLAALRLAGREGATRAQVAEGAEMGATAAWGAMQRLQATGQVVARQEARNRWRYWTTDLAPVVGDLSRDSGSDDSTTNDLSSPPAPYRGGDRSSADRSVDDNMPEQTGGRRPRRRQ